jgi:hypothetical protein
MNLHSAVSLHQHLDALRLQLETSTNRAEALAVIEQFFTQTPAAKQLGPKGRDVLVDIVSSRIAALPPG